MNMDLPIIKKNMQSSRLFFRSSCQHTHLFRNLWKRFFIGPSNDSILVCATHIDESSVKMTHTGRCSSSCLSLWGPVPSGGSVIKDVAEEEEAGTSRKMIRYIYDQGCKGREWRQLNRNQSSSILTNCELVAQGDVTRRISSSTENNKKERGCCKMSKVSSFFRVTWSSYSLYRKARPPFLN